MEKLILMVDINCKPNECWQCNYLGVNLFMDKYICRAYIVTLKERKTKNKCLALRCKQCEKDTVKEMHES